MHIPPTGCLIVVHVDALQQQVGIAMVSTSWIDAMLIGDHFPKFGANLIAALASLDMHKLSHSFCHRLTVQVEAGTNLLLISA